MFNVVMFILVLGTGILSILVPELRNLRKTRKTRIDMYRVPNREKLNYLNKDYYPPVR